MKPLTPKLAADLAWIVREYDGAIRAERGRWGEASAAKIAEVGVLVPRDVVSLRAVHELVSRGYLVMNSRKTSRKVERRGAYGRRLGGTRTTTTAALYLVPTNAARDAIAKLGI